ncbi:hypothetical protein A3K70_00210 [Candidatus Bathyarchaeota archaeon RBG_16_48_13]|nr:MAG: hypothetical protein A3K70_00210 [Candidatus Bathyarchaeota archaeon RBG_16_48_13]
MTEEKSDSELWKYVSNPDESLKGYRTDWLELRRIIDDLLRELKDNDEIESVYTKSEINHIKKVLKKQNEIVANFNKMY